ncbi:hypothetical protein Tco_0348740 [Tanacetum coccineum]
MDQVSAHMLVALKVPMLKPENGNAPLIIKVVEGVKTIIAPTTVEEKAQRRLFVREKKYDVGGNAANKKDSEGIF